jgi:rhodanese-related sulfurtransferase
VRPAAQHTLGHIKGDMALPIDQVAARQAELPGDRRLVFYCSCPAEELALDAARTLLAARRVQVAALVGGYDAWRAAGGATETQGTWEEIFHVSAPPSGWGKTPADTARCQYALDTRVFAVGKASARIACRPDLAARGFAGLTQKLDAQGLRGRTLTLSARVRAKDIERGAFLWIGAEDAQGRLIGMTRPEPWQLITGTGEWRPVEVEGVVPAAASKVLIGISLTTSGTVWLDDAQLVAPAAGTLPRVRVALKNPEFEH